MIFDELQKQYENERVTTNLANSELPQNDDKGPVVYPENVDKAAGVSAFGKTDRIRGIAAVLNQYYPVINIGDNEGNPFTFGSTLDDSNNNVIYYRQTGEITDTSADKIIKAFEYDWVSGQVIYSNLSKPTASAELIAKYASFKPEISNDIVAAMIANDGTITYIHRGDKYDTTDAHTQSGPIGQLQLAPVYQVDVDNAKADTKGDTQVKPNADVYNKLQKQYQDELATTSNEKVALAKFDDKGNMVVNPSKVNKSNGVSALGKTDRIRGLAAVLNQYYPVINLGDMVSADNISYGAGMGGYNYYYNDSVILTIDSTSKKIVYSNLSKSTASPELIAKYAGFKPVIANDIVAAIIGNDGVISYIHNTDARAITTDPNVKFYAPGQWLTPVYQVDVDNAIAADKAKTEATQKATEEAQAKALADKAKSAAEQAATEATQKATDEAQAKVKVTNKATASVPLKTRAEVQADIAAQKAAAKSAAKAAKKATRKVSTATVVPAAFTVNNLTQATNSNHVNVSSPVNTTISQSSVANTDNRDNLPKTDVSNDSKTNNFGIFASLLALISAAVLGLKKKFN